MSDTTRSQNRRESPTFNASTTTIKQPRCGSLPTSRPCRGLGCLVRFLPSQSLSIIAITAAFVFVIMAAPLLHSAENGGDNELLNPPSPPFLKAVNHQLQEVDVFRREEKTTSPTFAILCDPQLGFQNQNVDWKEELKQLQDSIYQLNRLRPDFVIVIGDLAQQWPFGDTLEMRDLELADFVKGVSELSPDIPAIIVTGNHDVGNRPTAETIRRHEVVFGDSYFSFRWTGLKVDSSAPPSTSLFIVVNSSLFFDPSGAPEMAEEQIHWLEEELKKGKEDKVDQILFFGHHPFFVNKWDEDADVGERYLPAIDKMVHLSHFQIAKERRLPLLQLLREYNVKYSFHGHTHWNSVIESNGLTQVITSAVGMQLGTDLPGLRVVHMDPSHNALQHHYKTLEELIAEERGAKGAAEKGVLAGLPVDGDVETAPNADAAMV